MPTSEAGGDERIMATPAGGVAGVFYKYLPIWSCASLLVGIVLAWAMPAFGQAVQGLMSRLVDAYRFIAPVAIFLILAPSLAKIMSNPDGNGKRFAGHAFLWFAKLRLAACLFAVVFTGLAFGLPLFKNTTVGLGGASLRTLKILINAFVYSPYFYAVYASLIAVVISLKVGRVARALNRCADAVERVGGWLVPLIPLFMLAVGAYIYQLPHVLDEHMAAVGAVGPSRLIKICGIGIRTGTGAQMFVLYCIGALLTGVACMIWHLGLLSLARWKLPGFSIRHYFKNYWIRVYPLLWATSSESLAAPLNLHLTRKYYPHVRPEVRRFAIGSGSFLGINGTMICVFILAGLTAGILGIEISCLQLLLSTIFLFVLGYGVPGIPGELVLFAGPLVELLGVPPEVAPTFVLLYVGLQIGLPDSFRTGANSTDNCISSLLLDRTYKERFMVERPATEPEMAADVVPVRIKTRERQESLLPDGSRAR